MSDTPSGDIVSKNPKTTLLTTFTAILETAIQGVKDDDYVLGIADGEAFGKRQSKYKYSRKV